MTSVQILFESLSVEQEEKFAGLAEAEKYDEAIELILNAAAEKGIETSVEQVVEFILDFPEDEEDDENENVELDTDALTQLQAVDWPDALGREKRMKRIRAKRKHQEETGERQGCSQEQPTAFHTEGFNYQQAT